MINKRRYLSDAEMYPEQFDELPYQTDGEEKKRKRSVRLADIGEDRGDLGSLLQGTAPKGFGRVANGAVASSDGDSLAQEREGEAECFGDGNGLKEFSRSMGGEKKESARAYAMRVVSGATVTEKKLYEKLMLREYSEDDAFDAIEYVKSFGYINDLRLAQGMVEKLAARRWGRFKICYYLKRKGVNEDVIGELDFSEIDFPAYCAELIKKYPKEKRDAMLRAVKNAGYSGDDYRKAMKLLIEG